MKDENDKIIERITIPYAVTDFTDLREHSFYYVDKTDYISKLEAYKAPVFLRPRRFGKACWFLLWPAIMTVLKRIGSKNCLEILGLAVIRQMNIIAI